MKAQLDRIRPEFLRPGPQGPDVTGEAAAMLQALATIEHVERGRPRQRQDYVNDRISLLLGHAQAHSRAWRERLPPRGVSSLEELPVLTRSALRSQVAAEGPLPLPPDHGAPIVITTSGSTGEPMLLYGSVLSGAYNEARYSYEDIAGERRLDLPHTHTSAKVKEFEALDRWSSRTGRIWQTGPGHVMPFEGAMFEETVARLLAGPGGYVVLRPAMVAALALRVEASGRPPPPFAEFITYGELVTAELREQAQRILRAPIADIYSAEEVGPIAFQCRRAAGHYHVASSGVVVEVVDERRRPLGEGKVGDLLVTGLHSLASPVVRYDLGDRAALLGRCPCGHQGPTLRSLVGRRRSLIRLPDGRLFFLRPTARQMSAIAPVEQWRALQTGPKTLVLEVAAARPLTEGECAGLIALVKSVSSADFDVAVRQVDAIDWGPGGKRHLVVNQLEGWRE